MAETSPIQNGNFRRWPLAGDGFFKQHIGLGDAAVFRQTEGHENQVIGREEHSLNP